MVGAHSVGGKRMHACFLLHPELCPGRGWTHDTEKAEGSYPGPSFWDNGGKVSHLPIPQTVCLPPERGGLGWPPEREVWKLVSGVARPTGTRLWAAAVGSSQGHAGTWVQSRVGLASCKYMQVFVSL